MMAAAPADFSGPNTLWQGELAPWMDDFFITHVWRSLGFQVQVRLIREKGSTESQKYCFVQFQTAEIAKQCLDTYNGNPMPVPDLEQKVFFRLNPAVGPTKTAGGEEYAIFVGDLGREVNDHMLYSVFRDKFQSVKNAKVVMDPATGNSKGFGFVRFSDSYDYQRALSEMQGHHVGSRAIRVAAGNQTTTKSSSSSSAPSAAAASSFSSFAPSATFAPPQTMMNPSMAEFNPLEHSPTNLYVSGFSPSLQENDLLPYFMSFGEMSSIKILPGKGIGFVNYVHPASASEAIRRMQGANLGGQIIRITHAKLSNPKNPAGGIPAAPYFGYGNPMMMNPYAPMMGFGAGMIPGMPAPVLPVPMVMAPPKAQPESLPPPDPLDSFSTYEENQAFVNPRAAVLLDQLRAQELYHHAPEQSAPLPLPLLY